MAEEETKKKHIAIKDIVKLFKYTDDTEFYMTLMQFLCTSFMLTLPANYLIYLIQIFNHGGLLLYILIIVFTYLCAMPLNFFYTFIGMYTGYSYIKFWKIAPFFKGIGFSVFTMPFFDAVNSLYISNFSIYYILVSLQANVPWMDCEFAKISGLHCLNMYPLQDYTEDCSGADDEVFPFPALVYFRNIGYRDRLLPRLVNYLIFATCMIVNVKKYLGIMTIITVTFAVLLTPVLYISIYSGQKNLMPEQFPVIPSDMSKYVLYAYLISLYREVPAGIVGLGARVNPKTIKITGSLLGVFTVKIIFIGLVFVWQTVGVLLIQSHYRIKNIHCLSVTAYELYFAIIPDMMSRWHVPQIWLIFWFLMLYFWSVASSIHMLTFNLNAVMNAYPHLRPCRNVLCILKIIILVSIEYVISMSHLHNWQFANRMLCCLIMIIMGIVILKYGIQRLCVDYYFVYGTKFSYTWTNLLKLSILINVTLSILSLLHIVNFEFVMDSTIMLALMLIPTFFYMFTRVFQYLLKKEHRLLQILNEDADFGHRNPAMNADRKKFLVEKKTKFSTENLRCRHRCIIAIKDQHPEVIKVEKRRLYLEKTYMERKRSNSLT